MIIVSNTSIINYLVLIEHSNLLSKLFKQIIIPQEVYNELSDAAPLPVQSWIAAPPDWLKIQSVSQPSDAVVDLLDRARTCSYPSSPRNQCRLTAVRRHEGVTHCNRQGLNYHGDTWNTRPSSNTRSLSIYLLLSKVFKTHLSGHLIACFKGY
jgi:hypothetical protein